MPVIINEFEVVVEPPEQDQAPDSPPQTTPATTPQDMERLLEHFKQRRARLHAD